VILGIPQTHSDCAINRTIAQNPYPTELSLNYPYANDGKPYQRSDVGLVSLTMNKKFEDITVTSTTGYYDQAHKGAFNGDRSELVQIFDTEEERYRMFNQELRANTDFAGPFNGMAGVYYEHSDRRFFNAPSILNVYDPVHLNYVTTVTQAFNKANTYSAFGQLRWKIVPELELAGGVRYTHDTKDTLIGNTQTNLATATGRGAYPEGQFLSPHYSNNNWSPDVTLTWKATPDQTIYAGYKTGYKAGGISNSAILAGSATVTNLVFGPEHAKGFEVGYKAKLLDNRVRVDLTAYRYNYNGLQVTAYDSVAVAYSLKNAAKARTYGITGTAEWAVTDALTLNGNFGWNHARYLSFPNSQCHTGQTVAEGCVNNPAFGGFVQDLSGKALNRAPDWTFKIGADYKADLPGGWLADLATSVSYSSSYQSQADYTIGGIQDAYWLLNAAIHLSPESEKYRISLIGRNLTNTYYKVVTNNQSLGTFNQFSAAFSRPREVIIEASYNF
jgi:outer membrane receptor protein involved in Fe transport